MPAAQTLSKSTPSAPTKPYGDRPPAVKVIQLGKTSASSQHSTRLVLAPVTVQPEHSGSEGEVERFEDPGELSCLAPAGGALLIRAAAARDVEFPSTLLARSRFRLAGGKAVTGHQWKVCTLSQAAPWRRQRLGGAQQLPTSSNRAQRADLLLPGLRLYSPHPCR